MVDKTDEKPKPRKECPKCKGSKKSDIPKSKEQGWPCTKCRGRGWVDG